ncbi:hypothetical protein [Pseudanabaena sp. FACHB-2040]|uniref:hypothetical protein n=1 Tax=Pseudanabaena sp. FACHB-2040 TaxID=2692859 RepID=UPI001F54AB82|nr:hypothetical protein [Pseudanabaena sp. FACHB-2040]
MSFFNFDTPIVSKKQSAFSIYDSPGLWRVHWQIKQRVIVSTFYTRHDQACLLWAAVSAAIFLAAQFLSLNWFAQAMMASGLTVLCVVGMVALTSHFSAEERLTWVLYGWSGLMLVGTLTTDLSLFLGWGEVLGHLCPLWLGISGIGYVITGLGMRSRAFMLIAAAHFLTIYILPHVGMWQPLTTGIVISGCALLIAEVQWDANGVCGYQAPLEADSQA